MLVVRLHAPLWLWPSSLEGCGVTKLLSALYKPWGSVKELQRGWLRCCAPSSSLLPQQTRLRSPPRSPASQYGPGELGWAVPFAGFRPQALGGMDSGGCHL